jgi:CheY-like chemotaxis protein
MRPRILVVDDKELNLEIVRAFLKNDYELASADTGEKALDLAVEFRPDLVLLDIMMPGLDGYEVCRRLKQDRALARASIIMLTAKAMPDERAKGLAAGADDYLTKPFRKHQLLERIAAALGENSD